MTQFDTILNLLHGAEYVHHIANTDVFLAWYGGDAIAVFEWRPELGRANRVHTVSLPSGFAKCPLAVVKMNAELWCAGLLEAWESEPLEAVLKRMTYSHTA